MKAVQGRNYIVTTGTGSGKSLCFYVPIINRILAARRAGEPRRTRAIVIYPMNALANSQREELEKFIQAGTERGGARLACPRTGATARSG